MIMEKVFHPSTVQLGLVAGESGFGDTAGAALAIGEKVKAHGQEAAKQFRTPAAAVKDHGGIAIWSQQLAHFG